MPRVRNSAKSAASQPALISVETEEKNQGLALLETKSFPVVQIQTNPVFQPRQLLNREVVDKYSDFLADEFLNKGETACPPIDLLLHEGQHYLIHGHHRLEAFKRINLGEITAKIWIGSWDKAIQFACEANIFNGLQLSRKEVAIACRRYIRINDDLPESERESDRAIARRFLVDPKSVRNYRKQNQAVSLVNSWNTGSTILLAKNWESFSLALKPFCYATYSGYFNPDDFTAYFQFGQQICFKNGQHSVFDFEPVEDEYVVDLVSSDPKVGSVVWFDEFYGFGVIYKIDADEDGDPVYYGLSWKRGLCKTYSIFVFSQNQAIALCKEFQEFFPIVSDLANLLPKLIAKLDSMLQAATDDLLNDRDPVMAKLLATRHEREIAKLTILLRSLTGEIKVETSEDLEDNLGSSQNLPNSFVGDIGDYSQSNDDDSDCFNTVATAIKENADKLTIEQLQDLAALIESLVESRGELAGIF